MSEHALFWFLFPRIIEIALCAVGISATAFLVMKSPPVAMGEEQ
jgi:hypothetical protein